MLQAILLIAFGAFCRLLPDTLNLVPMGAIALFAGSRLSSRIAWTVPVFAMIFSDIVLDRLYGSYFDSPTRWISYGALALIAVTGVLVRKENANIFRLAGLSLAGSILFFLASNFGCWAWPDQGGIVYPASLAGLMTCYTAGLPFLRNTVLADLIGTFALFSLAPLAARGWNRWVVKSPELVSAGTHSSN